MNIKETSIYDSKTGDMLIKKREPVDYFNEDGYLLFIKRNYSRVFSDIRIPESFTDSEIGKIYRLQEFIDQKTNMVMKRVTKGKRAMTLNEMIAVSNLSERQGREFVRKLVSEAILARVEVKCEDSVEIQYYFNPIYFHNSKRLSANLYRLFQRQIDPYLASWVKENFKNDKQEKT